MNSFEAEETDRRAESDDGIDRVRAGWRKLDLEGRGAMEVRDLYVFDLIGASEARLRNQDSQSQKRKPDSHP